MLKVKVSVLSLLSMRTCYSVNLRSAIRQLLGLNDGFPGERPKSSVVRKRDVEASGNLARGVT